MNDEIQKRRPTVLPPQASARSSEITDNSTDGGAPSFVVFERWVLGVGFCIFGTVQKIPRDAGIPSRSTTLARSRALLWHQYCYNHPPRFFFTETGP
jgi:hypothetical protein